MADKKLDSLLEDETFESEQTKRIKELSSKSGQYQQERDSEKAEKEKIKAELESKNRELAFAESFGDLLGQYPQAKEHKADIRAKYLAGYSADDATISVLAKAGKLTTAPERRESPAGGSAVTSITNSPEKKINEMSKDEKRSKLVELEKSGAWGMS